MAIRPLPAAASVPTRNGPAQPSGSSPDDVGPALEEHGAEDDRHEEEEREARRRVAVESERARHRDRDPRARDARREGDGLRGSDRQSPGFSERSEIFFSCGHPVASQRSTPKTARKRRDLPRLAEAASRSCSRRALPRARQECRCEHAPRGPLLALRMPPVADAPKPAGDERGDVLPEVRHDGDQRAEVESDVERLVEVRVVLEVRPVAEPRDEIR
jgi:hypothetical protein